MNGFLNVLKPAGMTSHDVVSFARRLLKTKKIGHTGTLDPGVAGVLVLCVGKATRLVEYILESGKKYRAELQLGLVTDTQDGFGKVIARSQPDIAADDLVRVLAKYQGCIEQLPPMYSAVRRNGQKLYELARRGIEVERKPRPVVIYDLQLRKRQGERVTFDVSCSKGTYIRTLCHDIGQDLGCGACMTRLIRTAVGPFLLADSWTLEELTELERADMALQPLTAESLPLPVIAVNSDGEDCLSFGKALSSQHILRREESCGKAFAVTDREGALLAIAEYRNGQWQPRKVFC